MRTRKTAASSAAACHRCTALLAAGAARCSLCGWPAGVGFPPADGVLPAQSVVAEAEVEPDPEPDHTQLDALSGMVERQHAPAPQVAEVPADEAPDADAPVPSPEPDPEPEAVVADEPAEADVDPLTAPLTDLSTVETETPIAAEMVMEIASEDEAPAVETGTDVETGEAPEPSTRNASGIQRIAQVLILAAALSNLALAGLAVVADGTTVVLGLSLVNLALWTAAAITFLHWVSRTYRQVVHTSAVPQRHGEVMAVAGWMIPIAGFVIGYRVLQDLWSGSDPQTRDNPDAGPAKARVIDVWLLGLLTACIFGYAMPLALGDMVVWGVLASAGVLTAGFCLVQVMTTISGWSTDTAELAGELSDATAEHEQVDEGSVTTRVDDLQAMPVDDEVPAPVE